MQYIAMPHQTGFRLVELGLLITGFAELWNTAAQSPKFKLCTARIGVAALTLTAVSVLLLTVMHWDGFG